LLTSKSGEITNEYVNIKSGNCLDLKQKLWSSSTVLRSQLEGRGIAPHPMLDGSGVKAMTGLIPAPNPGSFNIRKERK